MVTEGMTVTSDQGYAYRTLLACDIAGSAGRGELRLQEIRGVLRAALGEALAVAGLDGRDFVQADTGDGLVLVAPAALPKAGLLVPLLPELAARLREHNGRAAEAGSLRLRVAVHAGEVRLGADGGVSGAPLETLARLLDAAPLRRALRDGTTGTPVAAILSQHVYEETVGHGHAGLEADAFTAAEVRVKAFAAPGWLWYPGSPVGPRPGPRRDPDTVTDGPPADAGPRTVGQLVQATGNGTVFAVHRGVQNVRQASTGTAGTAGTTGTGRHR
jgi:hypothetical protein